MGQNLCIDLLHLHPIDAGRYHHLFVGTGHQHDTGLGHDNGHRFYRSICYDLFYHRWYRSCFVDGCHSGNRFDIGCRLLCRHFSFGDASGAWPAFEVAIEDNKFSLGDFGSSIIEPTFWVVFIYGIFINLQNFGIDQNYIQRYLVSSSDANAKKSAFYRGLLYLPVSAIFLFIGTALYAYYKVNSGLPENLLNAPDKVFPHFIVNELPKGVSGLLIASIFAAGMSSISTSFNSTSTVLLTDYFMKNASENQKLRFLYGSTVVICLISILIAWVMIDVKSILDVWWKYASILSGGMLGLFLLGVFSNVKRNSHAAIGLVVGILAILLLTLYSVVFPEREPLAHSTLQR